jgi:hypothetical protein
LFRNLFEVEGQPSARLAGAWVVAARAQARRQARLKTDRSRFKLKPKKGGDESSAPAEWANRLHCRKMFAFRLQSPATVHPD